MDAPNDLLSRPPEEGARLIALSWLDQAAAAFPRLQDPADTEALHDFRVGLRRLRSCLRSYRAYLEESLPKKLRRRLRDLAGSTGPGRDTEVQIEWLRGRSRHLSSYHRAGLSWIVGRLEERMRAANDEMSASLPKEFPRIEKDLRDRLSTYHTEIHLALPSPTLAEVTAGILRHQATELESHLARVDGPEDEHEAHEARISAKRLRYLLEPFDLPEATGIAGVIKRTKKLQEILGELHDAHVLEAELSESLQIAASERVRRLLEVSLSEAPDDALIRAERRRVRESGLLALARLNRARRNRLFAELEADWLEGRGARFFEEAAAVVERLGPHPPAPSPGPPSTPSPGEGETDTSKKKLGEIEEAVPEPVQPSEGGTRRPRFM
ncbi:MAG TPA: CHAD domain-containing protein [Thermoanaerobaculia bacterium]|nr:CHAD domain-containing protein [Thermoanaerobaculia bacterium]